MSKLSPHPQNQRTAAMLLAMAGAMLLRRDEYTHHHTHVEPAIAEHVTA